MTKIKLLVFAVIVLLLLNLGTLGFLFFTNSKSNHIMGNHPEGRRMPKEIIIEKLHFDTNQINDYTALIKEHQHTIRAIEDNIRETKNDLYLKLNDKTVNTKAKDSLIDRLSVYQKEIEITHFSHFEAIKKLCKENQLEDFELLTREFSRLFSKPPRPKND